MQNYAKAEVKYVRISPRKVKIVIDLIRNKPVGEALAILKHTPKAASEIVEKLLLSAIANAENNHGMDVEKLYVAEIYSNAGPMLKRIRARAQGRAFRILKRTSHTTIVLKELGAKEDVVEKVETKKEVKKEAPKAEVETAEAPKAKAATTAKKTTSTAKKTTSTTAKKADSEAPKEGAKKTTSTAKKTATTKAASTAKKTTSTAKKTTSTATKATSTAKKTTAKKAEAAKTEEA